MEAEVVNQLEDQISKSEKYIRKADALKRLRNNPDFVQLIEQDYLTELAAKAALYKGSDECDGPMLNTLYDKRIIGVGQFNDYLHSIETNADIDEQTIAACRAEIVNIESNEGDE